MNNKTNLSILCLMFLIGIVIFLTIQLVTAQTEVETQPLEKQVSLRFTCTLNNAIPSPSTEYNISISYPNGSAFISNKATTPLGNGAFSYSTNFTELGLYRVQSFCYDGTYSFSSEGWYDITPNGEQLSLAKILFNFGFVLILTLFLIFSIMGIFRIENYIARFTLYWVSHILVIALSFMIWTGADTFLTSAPFVVGFFKMIFYFSMISAFPMIILSLAWIFHIHLVNDDMKKMMDRGIDEDEAYDRAKKKRGRR